LVQCYFFNRLNKQCSRKDISGYTHGVGWCAPQQGACKLSLNVKNGIIEECLIETIGCSGMTHSAAMAAEILPGRRSSRP
jgi:NifU-like protein involved in Fe-S cluster formation